MKARPNDSDLHDPWRYLTHPAIRDGPPRELEILEGLPGLMRVAFFKGGVVNEILGRREPALHALESEMAAGYSRAKSE